MKYGYYVYLTAVCWMVEAILAGPRSSIVNISRCRVECVKKHSKFPDSTNDKACDVATDCHYCWELCPKLFQTYSVFGSLCQNHDLCIRGCETACNFRQRGPRGKTSKIRWQFPTDIHVKADALNTVIRWTRPVSEKPQNTSSPFVYTLLVRSTSWQDKSWQQLEQQQSQTIALKTDRLPPQPEFKLVAVNSDGMAAQKKFKSDSYPFRKIPSHGNLNAAETGVRIVNTTYNIQHNITELRNGELTVEVSWSRPPGAKNDSLYIVHWFLEDCNIYASVPYCDLPVEHNVATVPSYLGQKSMYKINEMLFNAEYRIQVELTSNRSSNSFIIINTPKCLNPSPAFTECIRLTHEEELGENPLQYEQATKEECITLTDKKYVFSSNDTKNRPREGSNMDYLQWNLNVSSITFNPETYKVEINITGKTPFNESAVNYTIAWINEDYDDYLKMKVERTSKNFFVLKVDPDSIYTVRAEAWYVTDTLQPGVVESKGLCINTSLSELNLDESPSVKALKRKPHEATVRSVIIAITCVISFIVVGFVIFFIYKKRKSFKDIIITKSTVSKSNSYKSNVGGKSDYSNQMMVISDEWELDPKQLKFCAPIGQGAFGKVVTGYFNDMKVAIKLVKEGAPLSYKEDLVAEINLMKKIGSHPNIVSMIGACTLIEPVALVMEYIPRGNLQTFLKKCRMEGDFRKRNDGQSEIIYSLVQDSGGIDNGVIIPADMLSFARQVAMAMEYLAEKKYVHRDLAARNVLLDYNKIVKVCDFGLSRDIYNDNEYKKLTNGKLPLKWMAIESLRDRIFTTHTDIWSFGILLWEIVTMGASPYPNIALADLYYILSNGYRMEKPSNCSDELYRIMRQCWEDNPGDRPSFLTVRLMIEELLEQDCDYLLLDNIDVPLNLSESSSTPVDTSNPEAGAGAVAASGNGTTPNGASHPARRYKNLKVNVCVHDQSTERLIFRPSESDSTSSP